MADIDLENAIVGHRKLRGLGESAGLLKENVDELLTSDDYPGLEPTLETARALQDRIRWILGEPELEHRFAGASHLLEHGVSVMQRLLDATTHENEDEDLANGWMRRVETHQDRVRRNA